MTVSNKKYACVTALVVIVEHSLCLISLNKVNIRAIDPTIALNLSQKLQKMFYAEKAFLGMEEMCPKVLGGYKSTPPPPKWGLSTLVFIIIIIFFF